MVRGFLPAILTIFEKILKQKVYIEASEKGFNQKRRGRKEHVACFFLKYMPCKLIYMAISLVYETSNAILWVISALFLFIYHLARLFCSCKSLLKLCHYLVHCCFAEVQTQDFSKQCCIFFMAHVEKHIKIAPWLTYDNILGPQQKQI